MKVTQSGHKLHWKRQERSRLMEEELIAVKKERDELREHWSQELRVSSHDCLALNLLRQCYPILHRFPGVFMTLLRSLTPKAERLTEWRGERETVAEDSCGRRPQAHIPVAEQFFAVLVHLRLCLNGQDIAQHMGISVVTFYRLFTMWVLFFSQGGSLVSSGSKVVYRSVSLRSI